MGQMGNLDQIALNLYNLIYLMTHSKDIYEVLGSIMGCNWYILYLNLSRN